MPNNKKEITIYLDFEKQQVRTRGSHPAKTFFQFSGYQYAKRLATYTPNKSTLFDYVGNIYWYDEQRNSYNFSLAHEEGEQQINFVRNFLANAYNYHIAVSRGERTIREGEFDFYDKLETIYKKIFPNRSFIGAAPRFDIFENSKAPDFFLSDGVNEYELSGMSAGERAIFPILMDFARWNINHSIIIIDELELHLHPPLQQALVRVLPKLGENNQFIYTSHSSNVIAMFNEEENQIIQL
ncbi:MAG: AAA family ATPase [Bacteroidota bacterium]